MKILPALIGALSVATAGHLLAADFNFIVQNDTSTPLNVQLGHREAYTSTKTPENVLGPMAILAHQSSLEPVPFTSTVDPQGPNTDSWILMLVDATRPDAGERLVAVSCPLDMHTVVDNKGNPASRIVIHIAGDVSPQQGGDFKVTMDLNPNLQCAFTPLRG
jgi:hypothetical protein